MPFFLKSGVFNWVEKLAEILRLLGCLSTEVVKKRKNSGFLTKNSGSKKFQCFKFSHRSPKISHFLIHDSSLFLWWFIDVASMNHCLFDGVSLAWMWKKHWSREETLMYHQSIWESSMYMIIDVELMHHWWYWWRHYGNVNVINVCSSGEKNQNVNS